MECEIKVLSGLTTLKTLHNVVVKLIGVILCMQMHSLLISSIIEL